MLLVILPDRSPYREDILAYTSDKTKISRYGNKRRKSEHRLAVQ